MSQIVGTLSRAGSSAAIFEERSIGIVPHLGAHIGICTVAVQRSIDGHIAEVDTSAIAAHVAFNQIPLLLGQGIGIDVCNSSSDD